eukprot:755982-Rhodomonas_salina.1
MSVSAEMLHKIPVLAAGSRADESILNQIAHASCTMTFGAGQMIVKQGEVVGALYVLTDGQVAVSISRHDRTDVLENLRTEAGGEQAESTSVVRVLRPGGRVPTVMCVWSMLTGTTSRVSISVMEGGATGELPHCPFAICDAEIVCRGSVVCSKGVASTSSCSPKSAARDGGGDCEQDATREERQTERASKLTTRQEICEIRHKAPPYALVSRKSNPCVAQVAAQIRTCFEIPHDAMSQRHSSEELSSNSAHRATMPGGGGKR